jgi:hypothetical protein
VAVSVSPAKARRRWQRRDRAELVFPEQVLLVRRVPEVRVLEVLEVRLVRCLDQRRPQLATNRAACPAARDRVVPVAAVADAEVRSVPVTMPPTSSAVTAISTR